jgi:hypothetical protein
VTEQVQNSPRKRVSVWRVSLAGTGVLLLILSVPIAILTPFPFIPIGVGIGVAGAALLARNSRQGKQWMARQINRHPRLDRMAPHWLKTLILGGDNV